MNLTRSFFLGVAFGSAMVGAIKLLAKGRLGDPTFAVSVSLIALLLFYFFSPSV
jgi:hypothetical protein